MQHEPPLPPGQLPLLPAPPGHPLPGVLERERGTGALPVPGVRALLGYRVAAERTGRCGVSAVILRGDARALPLPDESCDLIVTSPPYYQMRAYADGGERYEGQIGSEETPAEYITSLIACMRECMRVLKPEGSIFVNLGDKFSQRVQVRRSSHQPGIFPGKFEEFSESWAERSAGGATRMPRQNVVDATGHYVPEKSLMGLPWRFALACVDELGLILRRDIIWSKPSGLPESVNDRCRTSHEYIFHLVKQPRYYAAIDEIREPHQPQSIARSMRSRFAPDLSQTGVGSPNTLSPADSCHPLGKLPGSVWEIPSAPLTPPPHLGVEHFAAYPPALVRRIVLGWSPSGMCVECGEGRRPISDRELTVNRKGRQSQRESCTTINGGTAHQTLGWERIVTITGYACTCPAPEAPTRPAVVLDPFSGTGTTAMVADVLGRAGIGVERSQDYCRLAQWRTADPAERARALGVPKPPPVPQGQMDLFGGGAA